jgi:hypothetical protein
MNWVSDISESDALARIDPAASLTAAISLELTLKCGSLI